MAVVLGLDVAFSHLGLAVVEWPSARVVELSVLCTEPMAKKRGVRKADDDVERCTLLARGLQHMIRKYRPVCCAVEVPHGGARHARSARAMGLATGVVVAVTSLYRLPCEWVTPGDSKLALTGRRDAGKDEVWSAVQHRFCRAKAAMHGVKPASLHEHASDALAAIYCAKESATFRMAERAH